MRHPGKDGPYRALDIKGTLTRKAHSLQVSNRVSNRSNLSIVHGNTLNAGRASARIWLVEICSHRSLATQCCRQLRSAARKALGKGVSFGELTRVPLP